MSGNLFTGTVASGATIYVSVPIRDGRIGAFVGWLDAVSSATITLELTSIQARRRALPAPRGSGRTRARRSRVQPPRQRAH